MHHTAEKLAKGDKQTISAGWIDAAITTRNDLRYHNVTLHYSYVRQPLYSGRALIRLYNNC